MPNISFDTQEAIPEGLRDYAKQVDGKFVVDVVPGVKLNEFRDRNVAVSQQLEVATGVLTKLKPVMGESVEEFLTRIAALEDTAKKVKDGSLKTNEAIETEVNNRVGAMKTSYETRLAEEAAARAAAEGRATAADQKLNRSVIERHVTEAVVSEKSGANPGALADILTRAERVFQVQADGKLIAKQGDATIFGADGATPMTPIEWLGELRKTAPYLFKNSNGGGASGGDVAGGGYQGTGMSREDFNKLTPMQKLMTAHTKKKVT